MGWKYHHETGLHGTSQNEVSFCRFLFKRILNRPFEGFEGFEGVMKILETTPYDPNHPSLFCTANLEIPSSQKLRTERCRKVCLESRFFSQLRGPAYNNPITPGK